MSFLEHLDELRRRLIRVFLTIAIITVISLTFSLEYVDISGISILLPFPNPTKNIAGQAILRMSKDVLPDNVPLIQTSPGQVFLSEITVAVLIGVLVSMPYTTKQISAFLGPGLYEREKRMILRLVLPITVLFIIGALFSYFFVVPASLRILYGFGSEIRVVTFITISDLIGFVAIFILAIGFAFQLPIIMWVITSLRLVEPSFWRKNISYAVFGIVVFGAVITPDGSGITMWFISAPMILLYGLGYLILKMRYRST